MPRYSYVTKSGDRFELVMTIAEMQRRQKPDGSITAVVNGRRLRGTRDYGGDLSTVGTPAKSGWPLHSEAAGVWPGQVKEAEAHAASVGVPTKFDGQGRAVFTDPAHRRRFLKAHGLHDRSSFC